MSLTHLTPDELQAKISDPDIILIDIRNDHELVTGLLPNAIHLPLGLFASAFEQLPQNKQMIFYCRSGVRSIAAGEYAMSRGQENVSHLAGGILAWANAGLPLVPR